jgi:hypothetical protein
MITTNPTPHVGGTRPIKAPPWPGPTHRTTSHATIRTLFHRPLFVCALSLFFIDALTQPPPYTPPTATPTHITPFNKPSSLSFAKNRPSTPTLYGPTPPSPVFATAPPSVTLPTTTPLHRLRHGYLPSPPPTLTHTHIPIPTHPHYDSPSHPFPPPLLILTSPNSSPPPLQPVTSRVLFGPTSKVEPLCRLTPPLLILTSPNSFTPLLQPVTSQVLFGSTSRVEPLCRLTPPLLILTPPTSFPPPFLPVTSLVLFGSTSRVEPLCGFTTPQSDHHAPPSCHSDEFPPTSLPRNPPISVQHRNHLHHVFPPNATPPAPIALLMRVNHTTPSLLSHRPDTIRTTPLLLHLPHFILAPTPPPTPPPSTPPSHRHR